MKQDMQVPASDLHAERACLGACLLDTRWVLSLTTRGLRPEHFYRESFGELFAAATSIAERNGGVDSITLQSELERLGLPRQDRLQIDDLTADVPAAGHAAEYADRVIDLSRWRQRQTAIHNMQLAVDRRNQQLWAQAARELDLAVGGTRTDTYTPKQWASVLFDHFALPPEKTSERAIPLPFPKLTEALGGGLEPGEWCALSGPTSHGKSTIADQWLDVAARKGKRSHLYMTEMTAVARGQRLLARRAGVDFLKQRARKLTDEDHAKILAELERVDYGVSVAADWDIDDIVRDALRARYDFVVIDLLHGMHYEDERGLDRLSKAVQRLARVSTTIDGHGGTAVVAVTHMKEEGTSSGKVPQPTISSIKGGSSIKQDADFVMFVWQQTDERSRPIGDGEVWLAKGRSGQLGKVDVRLNRRRFRFEARHDEDVAVPQQEVF